MNRNHSHEQIKNVNANMRKSTSSGILGSNFLNLEYLVNILKCPLCSDHAKQAHMCPNCCKMFCGTCIKNWITAKKSECPHCLKSLRYTSTINCDALAKQIQQAISKATEQIKMQSPPPGNQHQNDEKSMSAAFSTPDLYSSSSQCSVVGSAFGVCPEHQLRLDYYCDVCSVSLCSDCAVLSEKHQGHKLCKFSQKKAKFQEKINQLIKGIHGLKKQLSKNRDQKLQIIENIHRYQHQKKQIFQSYLKKLKEKTGEKISLEFQDKKQLFSSLNQKVGNLKIQFQRLQDFILSQKKGSLIKKAIYYESQIQKAIDNDLRQIFLRKGSYDNQIVPMFGSKTFILDNYTYLKQKNQMLYSEPLFWKGIQWRLKIFPSGIDQQKYPNQKQKFLSIYLQMSKGHKHSNIYKYQILLINQLDRSKAIGCTFQNEFQQGTYWGLDRFANISFLYSENFIHPVQGYLQIVLNVRCSTYYHAVKDQNYLVNERLKMVKNGCEKLRTLQKQVIKKGIKIKTPKSSSQNLRALVDIQQPRAIHRRIKSNSFTEDKKPFYYVQN